MGGSLSDPDGTREEILAAAFCALCDHGYADLTIKRIGDAFAKSPSLVYHHYDGKDELLLDLLEFTLAEFQSEAMELDSQPADGSARAKLSGYLSATIDPGSVDDPRAPDVEFLRVLMELRAQATHDDGYRDHFDRSDRVFREFLTTLVRAAAAETAGTDEDTTAGSKPEASEPATRSVHPREVATTFQTMTIGGVFQWATTGDPEWVPASKRGMERYLDAMLPLVDPAAEAAEK